MVLVSQQWAVQKRRLISPPPLFPLDLLSSSSSGEVDSRELYRVVAGILPGDFEVRVHSSEVIVRVASRAEDLLEAGKVALEAIGETKAAADMQGGAAAADSIDLEVGNSGNSAARRGWGWVTLASPIIS